MLSGVVWYVQEQNYGGLVVGVHGRKGIWVGLGDWIWGRTTVRPNIPFYLRMGAECLLNLDSIHWRAWKERYGQSLQSIKGGCQQPTLTFSINNLQYFKWIDFSRQLVGKRIPFFRGSGHKWWFQIRWPPPRSWFINSERPSWLQVGSHPSVAKRLISYPLVNCYITMENHHAINGKTHYKWPFSIAMLNYQRVYANELGHCLVWFGIWDRCGVKVQKPP